MASTPYKQRVVSQEELDAAQAILALGMTSPATQLYTATHDDDDKENAGNSPDLEYPNWCLFASDRVSESNPATKMEVDKSQDDWTPVAGAMGAPPPGPTALSPAQDNNFKIHNWRSKRRARAAQPYSMPTPRPAEGSN